MAFLAIGAGTAGDPLRLSQFSGFSVPSPVVISLTSLTGLNYINNIVMAGETAIAVYQIASNGKVYKTQGATTTEVEQWCTPTSEASNYEVYATLNSSAGGGLDSGTTGAWLSLNTNRTWAVYESTSGNLSSVELGMQIRRIGTSTVLASATITLEAEVL